MSDGTLASVGMDRNSGKVKFEYIEIEIRKLCTDCLEYSMRYGADFLTASGFADDVLGKKMKMDYE